MKIQNTVELTENKTIALIAHDNRKADLLTWVKQNKKILQNHKLLGTGTTGKLITQRCDLPVRCFDSGPLGGDQQIGAEMSYGKIDIVIFFWDPLTAQPHDPDVRALLRLSVVYNVPTACNIATADFLISSPFFQEKYEKKIIDYASKRPPINI